MPQKKILKDTAELEIIVSADKELWEKAQEKAFNSLHKNLLIKGFRKGNVPLRIASESIDQNQIWAKASITAIDELVKTASKELTKDDIVIGQPTYKINTITAEELNVSFIYPMFPKVKLSDYKKLGISYKSVPFTKKDVAAEISKLRESHSLLKGKDGPIKKGDYVTFDFEGFVDDKPFDGGKAVNFELEIGSKRFIPGFEVQMIGIKKGEKKDLKIKFPDDYHSEDLKGKEATFKILIKQIKFKDLPKLDDEFVKQVNIPNVNTFSELEKYIERVFTEQNNAKSKEEFAKKALTKLKNDSFIPISNILLAQEVERGKKRLDENIKKQKTTWKEYFQKTGLNQVSLSTRLREESKTRLEESLILSEIARQEKIDLKDSDYNIEYEKLAKIYNQPIEALKKLITKEQIQIPLTNDRVLDLLIKYNN